MKVQLYPGDEQGVGFYRMRYPALASGLDVEFKNGLGIDRAYPRRPGIPMRIAPSATDADVLVFQRVANPEVVALIPALQAKGHAVVVDMDDNLHAIHHKNVASSEAMVARIAGKACQLADMVTVSSEALAQRYGSHGRVRVLPNCVPERLLDMPRSSDGLTVGWAGWVGTHPEDLQVTEGGVAQALADTDARYLQVGPGDNVQAALGLPGEPEATGGLSIEEYYQALGRLDVGICPLQDSRFNEAKSGLKPLEMTARGAAVVMSPRTEYQRLGAQGLGVVAKDRARSWRSTVRALLQDEDLRASTVAAGQTLIAESYTYEGQGWRWAEAWADALENARGRHTLAVAA